MRRFLVSLLCLLPMASGFSQAGNVTVADLVSRLPLQGVNLQTENGKTYSSGANGQLKFRASADAEITVTHIGYLSVKTQASELQDTLWLEPVADQLGEVVVSQRTIEILRPKKSIGQLNPRNFGDGGSAISPDEIYAIFIPNTTGKNFQLRSISLEPTDYSIITSEGDSEKRKGQKYAPFQIAIYGVDARYGIPDKPMTEAQSVKLENGRRFATLRLKEPIIIGPDGFFIIVSSFDKAFYENLGFRSAPAFQKIQADKDTPYLVLTKATYSEDAIWRQSNRNRAYNEVFSYRLEVTY